MRTPSEYEGDIADYFANYGVQLDKLKIANINSDVCPIDFIYSPKGYNVYIELKTRTTTKDKYENTIIGKNKIAYFKNRRAINKRASPDSINIFYLIFGFITDIPDELEYHYLAYSQDRFVFYDDLTWKGEEYL